MPIGSGAQYKPAGIQAAQYVLADQEYFYKLNANDPMRTVYAPGSWTDRDSGTQSQGISLPIPDNLIVPDATLNPYSTPNNAAAFLMPDGKTLVQLEPLARTQPGGPIYGYHYTPDVNIYGDGIGGSHFGSGLSAIGGSIRLGELESSEPIDHALKVNIWGQKYLSYSGSTPGYRWPADRADSYAASNYRGTNPDLKQGSLLALSPNLTEASLGLQTPAAKKLFHALQDYGAYVADDSGWDAHYFDVEAGVPAEFKKTYGYDMETSGGALYNDYSKLFQALNVVTNNGPSSIGGVECPVSL